MSTKMASDKYLQTPIFHKFSPIFYNKFPFSPQKNKTTPYNPSQNFPKNKKNSPFLRTV